MHPFRRAPRRELLRDRIGVFASVSKNSTFGSRRAFRRKAREIEWPYGSRLFRKVKAV
jgi:hypothetical protein